MSASLGGVSAQPPPTTTTTLAAAHDSLQTIEDFLVSPENLLRRRTPTLGICSCFCVSPFSFDLSRARWTNTKTRSRNHICPANSTWKSDVPNTEINKLLFSPLGNQTTRRVVVTLRDTMGSRVRRGYRATRIDVEMSWQKPTLVSNTSYDASNVWALLLVGLALNNSGGLRGLTLEKRSLQLKKARWIRPE